MNIIARLKYRWKYCKDPSPGEVEPDPHTGAVVLFSFSPSGDLEPSLRLRRWRGLMGYGPGWTFEKALKDFAWDAGLLLSAIGWVFCFIALPIMVLMVSCAMGI